MANFNKEKDKQKSYNKDRNSTPPSSTRGKK